MITSRAIFIVIALLIVGRLFYVQGMEAAMIALGAVALLATMVWFNDFWARYILTFGFWESKASDFKSPGNSKGAIVMIAWVLLILMAYKSFFP